VSRTYATPCRISSRSAHSAPYTHTHRLEFTALLLEISTTWNFTVAESGEMRWTSIHPEQQLLLFRTCHSFKKWRFLSQQSSAIAKRGAFAILPLGLATHLLQCFIKTQRRTVLRERLPFFSLFLGYPRIELGTSVISGPHLKHSPTRPNCALFVTLSVSLSELVCTRKGKETESPVKRNRRVSHGIQMTLEWISIPMTP
jgi:hypothetical protein